MKVITEQEFARATKLDKVPVPGLTSFLMEVTKINEVNNLLAEVKNLEGLEFVDRILEILNIELDFNKSELKNIPLSGAFIAMANHPYGGLEGLILLKLLGLIRPETRLMANFLLNKIENIKKLLIAVNPFENIVNGTSISGVKFSLKMLKAGVPLAIFPAGEVSAFQPEVQQVTDKQWHPVVGKLVAKAAVPVLPIYFHGGNGILFNLLGLIHPMLRTAKLPSELFNKKGHVVKVRIGKPISQEEIAGFNSPAKLLNYLRARTYVLGAGLENQKKLLNDSQLFKIKKRVEDIINPVPALILQKEIDLISETAKVCEEKHYEVFIAHSDQIPNILREIGRLREVTFREIGEGTNKSIDVDRYDIYYNHLFIWDRNACVIVGAYRIGKGDEIYYSYGKKGFYLAELFKVDKELNPLLSTSLELGRSWVRKEYQQKPLPLFLLWKGIMRYLMKYPQYKYLVGPVSISNSFSKFSKSLMVNYILDHHFDNQLAKYVKPRKKFKVDFSKINGALLLENRRSLKDVDALIADLEQANRKIPVLLRQYISLNAKIICFNIDPKFSDSLDGFLVLNLEKVPKEMLNRLDN
ncbi:lysophospholipid acyltransferase family protein [Desertivirga arenae]|uniref:lysophospholipid acyltransferase family protein n=1 Tax=Desertivirga arenae TaxID=2810309 RepID=UPI001A977B33|nr:lysophospholipid acyltransferase family protein [Pedobacter sp. SYSU D00823]